MKKYYQVTKIGNSLFATLPSRLVKLLQLQSGDKVAYELVPGKRKIILKLVSKLPLKKTLDLQHLSKEDKQWIKKMAGSLTIKS